MVVYSIQHLKHIVLPYFYCIIGAIVLIIVYYPRRSQKSMGATGRKISSFLLTQYIDSYLEIFLNSLIKMWEQFRIPEFVFIIWLILIGQIFLMSSSDLVSMFSTTVGLTDFFNDPFVLCAIVPMKSYTNAEAPSGYKSQILKDNQNKYGVYMWKNIINKKKYIGSSQYLHKRFAQYFNINHLLKNTSMNIYRALLKHGYSNFSLEIIEYCEVSDLLIKEKHYWDKYTPEYNIAQDPTAPMSGRTHSEETKQILSPSPHLGG